MDEKEIFFILGDVRELVRTRGATFFWQSLEDAFPDAYRLLKGLTPDEKLAALLKR